MNLKSITLRFVATFIIHLVILTIGVASAARAEQAPILVNATTESQLDLAHLKSGLRKSDAIGFLTKLSLKNQLEELLTRFADFHNGSGAHNIESLQQEFEALFAITLDLVREDDPFLHDYLIAARVALWQTVRDPDLFQQVVLQDTYRVTTARRR